MAGFIDFEWVKRLASLDQVAAWLGLEIKNNRCQCPVNEGDKREMVFTFEKGLWHCFGCKKRVDPKEKVGGDQIALVSHVLQVDQQQAAAHISKHFHGYEPAKKGLPPDGLTDLVYEHEFVQVFGLTPTRAEELGIGWRKGGVLATGLHVPIRDHTGKLRGYFRYAQDGTLKFANSVIR